ADQLGMHRSKLVRGIRRLILSGRLTQKERGAPPNKATVWALPNVPINATDNVPINRTDNVPVSANDNVPNNRTDKSPQASDSTSLNARAKNQKEKNKNKKRERAERVLSSFADFWGVWPHKVSKQSALKAWGKLEPDPEAAKMITGRLKAQIAARAALEAAGKWVSDWPHPATWLNGRRWEDEIESAPGGKGRQKQKTPADIEAANRAIRERALRAEEQG
ncbi:MAG: hypothetical protein V3T83_15555, partial [Acidobacteriota bacterium]